MNTVRRIASGMLGVGESKVRFKPEAAGKIGEALTRDDVRALIKDGSIMGIAPRGVSRIRGRMHAVQKRSRRRSGPGSRKGTANARRNPKESWIAKVRSQRRYLFALVAENKLQDGKVRKIYKMIKGNAFKGVKVLDTYLKENKMMK